MTNGRSSMRVLLLGNETALFETVVAMALDREGATVVRGYQAGRRSLRSRHHHETLAHPALDSEQFQPFMLDLATTLRDTVLLPLTDAALIALQPVRPLIDTLIPVAAPPAEAVAIALDKYRTAETASRVPDGLAIPHAILPGDADHAVTEWTGPFPVLVKPRTGTGGEGIRLARHPEELRTTYALVAASYDRPIVQAQVPHRTDQRFQLAFVFDHDGLLRSWYGHRVIAEARSIRVGVGEERVRGGIALLWESMFDRDLLAQGVRLMQATGWRGVGVIEGAFDERDGTPYLFEINSRLCSTQSLSLRRDVNVAYDACRVALALPPAERLDFRSGVRAKLDPFRLVSSRVPRAIAATFDPRYESGLPGITDPRPALGKASLIVQRIWRGRR